MYDDYIFVTPGFLNGAGRALDIGGSLGQGCFLISPTPAEADVRALESDWRKVGEDLSKALEVVGNDVKQVEPPAVPSTGENVKE